MKIGFIGLKIMRSRMAVNLQNHGYSLIVFDRTRAKAEPFLGPLPEHFRVGGEVYRLAMREGHAMEDFSAI
jgi:6-phosphogluconate dehydrogenase